MRRVDTPLVEPRIAILLSTFQRRALSAATQLESLLAQSYPDWTLYWRDDGSSDATVAMMQAFANEAGQGRCVHVDHIPGRLRPTASFLSLLRMAHPALGEADMVAFADQDDVWLPEKLARGAAALRQAEPGRPSLYCARQVLVDAELRRLGISPGIGQPAGFPAALTQNVTTGCTIMLNHRASALIAASQAPSATLHDWWCYLTVTAAGGALLDDDEPVVLYRQHTANLVGAPRSMSRRAVAAMQRGSSVFMNVLRQHVAALLAQPELMAPASRAQVQAIDRALRGGPVRRLAALRMAGLRRQTWPETMLFRIWFLLG